MSSINSVWNNFCKSIKKGQKDNEREMTFEKSTMTEILSLLGWSRFKENIEEQKRMQVSNTDVIADFVLLNPADKRDEIIIELKRPSHTQTKADVSQLWSYMKQSYAPYGLYIGEKIEIYYNKLDDRHDPSWINTIEYTENNKEGAYLFSLLNADSFDEAKWKNYCEDSIKLMKSVEHWTSDEGKAELFQFILDKAGLSPDFSDRLRSILSISVQKNTTAEKPNNDEFDFVSESDEHEKQQEAKNPKKSGNEYELDGKIYHTAKEYALNIVRYLIKVRPDYDYDKIKKIFPKSFSWGQILLKWDEVIQKKKSSRDRYFTDQPLRDSNGISFVVSNQWTHDNVIKMREALDKELKVKPKLPKEGNAKNGEKKKKIKYSLDGIHYSTAAAFGYNFVRKFLQENPKSKISDVQPYLPIYLWSFKTIVTEEDWEREYKNLSHKRYYKEAVVDSEEKRYIINNQWDRNSIANMSSALEQLGWTLSTKEE